jgi:LmbE family N-acetylglucosaminyl deacetylase
VAAARLGLRLASRPYVPPSGGVLIVAPHADDETLGCGGLIATLARAGRRVDVAYLTDSAGSPPEPGWPEARRREALAALAVLGLGADRAQFLELPDGTLDRLPPERRAAAIGRLAGLISGSRPAEVFTPYRAGGSTEHTAAWDLTTAALRAAGGGRLMEYPVWAWWDPRRLRPRLGGRRENFRLALGPLRAVKRRALACHGSQVAPARPGGDPPLPVPLADACCGRWEFFFASPVSPP